jgi:hypothetical protein
MPFSTFEEEKARSDALQDVLSRFKKVIVETVPKIVDGEMGKDMSFGGVAGGEKFDHDVSLPYVLQQFLNSRFFPHFLNRESCLNSLEIPLFMNPFLML